MDDMIVCCSIATSSKCKCLSNEVKVVYIVQLLLYVVVQDIRTSIK
jgi:hypothetical protein